jgi:hypothetical protein
LSIPLDHSVAFPQPFFSFGNLRRSFMRKSVVALLLLAACSFLAAQQVMKNDSVIKLVKAGLSDDLIVTTINGSPGAYDTSTDAIIALKSAGASDKVIAAILARVAPPAAAPVAAPLAVNPEATSPAPPRPLGEPRIFVKADPDFGVALAAALNKKRAPATIVLDEKSADYVLQSAAVAAKEESGASKIARCLFAYCAGIEGTSSVSVQLIQVRDGSVVWAYQVRKANGGPVGIQSLSEAVAKHLKNEFLDPRK